MKKTTIVLAAAGLALMSAVAYAQMHHGPGDASRSGATTGQGMQGGMQGGMHGGMMQGGAQGSMPGSQGGQPKGDAGPSSLAFQAVNMKMHSAMDITFTGNADADFMRGMIPHHAGAIDMAKVVLAFGKDPEVRKLAESIIKAQETEIAQMQDWLRKNGK